MAKSKAKETKSTPKFDKPRGGCRPFWGILFFVLGVLILVSLIDFDPQQHERNQVPPEGDNLVGAYGVQIAYWSFYLLGGAGWLIPLACGYFSYAFFRFPRNLRVLKVLAVFACLLSAAALFSMQERVFVNPHPEDLSTYPMGPGGVVGSFLYAPTAVPDDANGPLWRSANDESKRFPGLLNPRLGVVGSGLVLSAVFVLGMLLLVTGNISETFQKFFVHFGEWRAERAALRAKRREEKAKERDLRLKEKEKRRQEKTKEREEKKKAKPKKLSAREKLERELDGDDLQEILPVPGPAPATKPASGSRKTAAVPEKISAPALKRNGGKQPAAEEEPVVGAPLAPGNPDALPPPDIQGSPREAPKPKIIKSETLRKAPVKLPERQGDYHFPTLDLLAKPERVASDDRENHEETAKALIHTLATFGVEAAVDEIHVGPVITRFDILPAPGTKVSKIQGLENDIAMGLKALAVRILAPVPGKGCVGVEIPNRQPQPVCLREIIESEDWSSSRAEIPIGLGKDVSGKPLVADLTKMPHLLIAGSTGSGKTVCINSIIASLLYHATPEELRFIMVDPKIVEMKVFNDLPHMLIPVVTEPKKVPGALKWLLNEMERRYQCFAAIGVRNIAGFHAYRKKEDARKKAEAEAAAANREPNELDGNLPEAVAPEVTPEDGIEIPKTLPYIVCIIDELADLMMVAPAEIETGIARLAQLARAAGIHLILATQRPSVNVITGIIKANLPSRISFKVASKVDSRTILDTGGADTLIGRGDMLFLPPGSSRLIRSQGAFVSDEEIVNIVENLKRNGPPIFAEEVQRQIDAGGDDGEGVEGGDEEDELFQDALEVLRTTKRASTSMLQRRLRIGYNRAARIMELMEQRGVVGPENGSSPREILVDLESM